MPLLSGGRTTLPASVQFVPVIVVGRMKAVACQFVPFHHRLGRG